MHGTLQLNIRMMVHAGSGGLAAPPVQGRVLRARRPNPTSSVRPVQQLTGAVLRLSSLRTSAMISEALLRVTVPRKELECALSPSMGCATLCPRRRG